MRSKTVPNKKRRYKAGWIWGYAFVAPTIIGLIILNIIPFFQSIGLSLTDKHTETFGLSNYIRLFTKDDYFWTSNLNTLYFTILTVPTGVLLALVLAVFLNTGIKGKNIYRGIYFLPLVCAPAAIAMVWKWVVFNSKSGFLNYVLEQLGIQGPNWIADPKIAMVSVAIIAVWSSVGYDLVLILAGLQVIPKNYYEAATIDGASSWHQFRHITIPMVSPALFFVFIMRTMNAVRQFDLSFMFAKDTDVQFRSIQTLLYQFYRETFIKLNPNYGSAIALWTVFIILLLTLFQFVMEKKWVHYDQ